MRLHIENRPVVIVRSNFTGKQLKNLSRLECAEVEFEAAEILELFTREIAPHYYNRAIFDVQTHLKERFESIESDLWALEKN